MRKLRIGLDYGDTIADCVRLKSYISSLFGVNVAPRNFNRDYVLKHTDLTADQYFALCVLMYNTKSFGTDRLNPVAGALEGVLKLIQDGHDVQVITSHWAESRPLVSHWLKSKNLDISVIGVDRNESKKEATQGLDIFLDDELSKLVQLDVPHRFLLARHFGKTVEVPLGITVVHSWLQFYEEVRKIAESE